MKVHHNSSFYSCKFSVPEKKKTFITLLFVFFIIFDAKSQVEAYPLKSLFIEAAVRFITWPDSATHTDSLRDNFVIGVFEKDKMIPHLKRAFSKKQIKDKSVSFLEIDSLSKITFCDLLFISDNQKYQIKSICNLTTNNPILTVSDSPDLIRKGVILSVIVENSKIVCYINESSASKSHFKISHHLLQKSIVIDNQEHKS